MRTTSKRLLTLCVIYCSLLGSGPLLVKSEQVADRLQQVVAAVNPSFGQGLVHLNQLFDLVIAYDSLIVNGINALHSSIQGAIQSALNSIVEADRISTIHLNQYQEGLNSLSRDISNQQGQLNAHRAELDRLTAERATWQAEANRLQAEVTDLEGRVRSADEQVARANQRVTQRRRNRWKWIAATVVTGGLAAPGLVLNERDIQRIKNDRAAYEAGANERRNLLHVALNNLNGISQRQQAIEQSINNVNGNISSAQRLLSQLQAQLPSFTSVGAEIKRIVTFLSQFNSNLSNMNSKQQLFVALRPLLTSIDSLVVLLENNSNLVSLLGDRVIVNRLRSHIPNL